MQNNSLYARIDQLDARLVRRDEVMSLISSGQMIKAIKIYREDTGASLSDAKIAVERMEQQIRLGLFPSTMKAPIASVASIASLDTGAWREEVERLLRQRLKIQAIKLYRKHTGVGLREAKDAVDRMEEGLPVSSEPRLFELPPMATYPSDEVRRLLLEGRKIHAIKVYREQTGVGLREAKEVIDRIEEELHVNFEPRFFEPPSLDEEARRLLLEGRKIQAIKVYREQTGVGLYEAKNAVDQIEHDLRFGK